MGRRSMVSCMSAIHEMIASHVWLACLVLTGAFVLLAKCADVFVEASVTLAQRLRVPRLVVGIVLVSLAFTRA